MQCCARRASSRWSSSCCPTESLLAPIEEQDAGFQEADCARIFAQLAAAVAHLHAHGWAHRDIKPENVCLAQRDDGAVAAKLVDFGSAASRTR